MSTDHATAQSAPPSEIDDAPLAGLAVRGGIGGVLMGLANLVPGISGGTMLLAAGVYPRFINAIAEVTTFRFRKPSIVVLASVVGAAIIAIGLFAGGVKSLVVDYRWVMYSLFIGLTLGGVPVVWKLVGDRTNAVWAGAFVGFLGMAALAWFQQAGAAGGGVDRGGFLFMFLAGVAGASAMILPGVSGGYLLLVLGVYVPILGGIAAFKDGLKAGDMSALMEPFVGVVLPVGIGVVIGVVAVSNLLRILLRRYQKATLGVLLGLLVGAVVGLWPFQEGMPPKAGSTLKGQIVQSINGELVLSPSGKAVSPEDYPTAYFSPSLTQIGASFAIVIIGFGLTSLVGRLGEGKDDA